MNEIDTILTQQINKHKSPSVHYVIFTIDKVIHRFINGFADINHKKKITEHTTYNAYSVTKTFTALAVLQLAERNTMDIDLPVQNYMPEFPYTSNITVRQLLNHTSGIPNPIPLNWIHLAEDHNMFDRNTFFKQIFHNNSKTKSQPNEKFAYSNLGFVLLGQLIEKVSGYKYEDYIRTNIIDVLGVGNDELDFTINNKQHHAKGYHKKLSLSNFILGFMMDKSKFLDAKEGKWNSFKNLYVNGASYGGLIGTSGAFVKYIQELLKPSCQLITDEYKEMLFTENYTNKGEATGMCMSWFSGQLGDNKYFAHAGGGGGYYCELRIYPDQGIGSVIMFNRTGMRDERFLDRLDKFVLNA